MTFYFNISVTDDHVEAGSIKQADPHVPFVCSQHCVSYSPWARQAPRAPPPLLYLTILYRQLRMFRIQKSTGNIENLGTKVVFRGTMCSKVFWCNEWYWNRWIFVICDWCLPIHIHDPFIHKNEVFSKIFIREISNIYLVLYFSQNSIFNTALEIILRMIFLTIDIYYYLTVPFCREHVNVVHSCITYGGEMWKILPSFSTYSISSNWQKYNHYRKTLYEWISPRTVGHLIDEKYQVTGHYLCAKYILGCPELHFWRVCNGGIRSYGRL